MELLAVLEKVNKMRIGIFGQDLHLELADLPAFVQEHEGETDLLLGLANIGQVEKNSEEPRVYLRYVPAVHCLGCGFEPAGKCEQNVGFVLEGQQEYLDSLTQVVGVDQEGSVGEESFTHFSQNFSILC